MDAAQILAVLCLLGAPFLCYTQHAHTQAPTHASHTQAPTHASHTQAPTHASHIPATHTQAPHTQDPGVTQAPHTQDPGLTQAPYTQAPHQGSPCFDCHGTTEDVAACLQTQPVIYCDPSQTCEVFHNPHTHETHVHCTHCNPHHCVNDPEGIHSSKCVCCNNIFCVKNATEELLPSTLSPLTTTHSPETTQEPDVTQAPATTQEPDVTQAPATTQEPGATQTPPATTQSPAGSQTPPATTQSPGGVRCVQCGDYDTRVPCNDGELFGDRVTPCADHTATRCMTDVITDSNAAYSIFKRCTYDDPCQRMWYDQTSDKPVCLNFDPAGPSPDLSCHFCCVGDGCNKNIVPDYDTQWRP